RASGLYSVSRFCVFAVTIAPRFTCSVPSSSTRMELPTYLNHLKACLTTENGTRLADLLHIKGSNSQKLLDTARQYKPAILERECHDRIPISPFDDVALRHILVLVEVGRNDYSQAYTEQNALVQSFLRAFPNLTRWCLPVLYTIHNDLWLLAVEADEQLKSRGEKGGRLENAARNINKAFTACITDRGPLVTSRRWGTYYIINLLFKTYFRLKQQNLCKNVLRAVRASADLPGVEQFPKAHRVTYRYYLGVLNFLEEDYRKVGRKFKEDMKQMGKRDRGKRKLRMWRRAGEGRKWERKEKNGFKLFDESLRTYGISYGFIFTLKPQAEVELTLAFKECHKSAKKNKRHILNFLLPTLLVRGVLPSRALLDRHPRLRDLYAPLVAAMRAGNVLEFDRGLVRGERALIARGTYLTVENARVIVLRMLFRKVLGAITEPYPLDTFNCIRSFNIMDRATKLPIAVFQQALAFVGVEADLAEVECMLANMIYKGFIKGYISHEKMYLVLSAKDAFPSFVDVYATNV
ncbi:hypothetical protein BC937DRAFT_88954, partial [Endogone sp. FLAS-F59071]